MGRKARRGVVRSADETVAVFAAAAGCGAPRRRAPKDEVPADGTALLLEDREGCAAPIARVVVHQGGHQWPGRPPHFRPGRGRATEEIDATRAIASFFFEGRAP